MLLAQADWADSKQPQPSMPVQFVRVSAKTGSGVDELRQALQDILQD
jgi:50S ribosomal subunit-associated GTPase HflX